MGSKPPTPRFRFVDTHAEKMLGIFTAGGAVTATALHRALRRKLKSDELTIGAIYRALEVLVRVDFVESIDSLDLEKKRLKLLKQELRYANGGYPGRALDTVSAAKYRLTLLGEAAATAYRLRLAVDRRLGVKSRAWLASQMRGVYLKLYQASLRS